MRHTNHFEQVQRSVCYTMVYFEFLESLPDINLNRDETELQIFTGYFNQIDQKMIKEFINEHPEQEKDIQSSIEHRTKGNIHYNNKNYGDALSSYFEGIVMAPRDSVEYGLSLANRSAVLFDLKRYKDCLVDIDRILKSEYPKTMLYKIFIRQAKCFVELKLYGKAFEAIQNAKGNFEISKVGLKKLDIDDIVKKINNIEKTLEKTSNVKKTVNAKEQSSLPGLTNGENPQFVSASNAVAMKKNNERGRHVVANADIKKGDVLFVEEPYSTAMYPMVGRGLIFCSHCFTSSLTCIPCLSCVMVVFCSDRCRQQYWNTRHRWECVSIKRMIITCDLNLALGVLFQASHTGLNTIVSDEEVFGNKHDNYPYVNQRMTHKNNIPRNSYIAYVKIAVYLVIYLIHFTDYFTWLYAQENRPLGSRDNLHRIVGGLLLRILCQNEVNMEIVMDLYTGIEHKFNIGVNRHKLGVALYVSSNLMNHSCLPNTVKSFYGSTKIVRALTDIKQGTEITVSYVKEFNIAQRDVRRCELLEEYYFTCTCRACVEQNSLSPWLCISCRGRALTTSTGDLAKCLDCQRVFPLDNYNEIKESILSNIGLYLILQDVNNLDKAFKMMKHIYHEANWNFTIAHSKFIHYYEEIGNFKSCLEHIEMMDNVNKAIFGDTAAAENVSLLLKHCHILVKYCLALKFQKPGLYKNCLKRTKATIKKSRDFLKYYMRDELVDNYQQNMYRILDSGDPNYAETMFEFHYNIINPK